MNISEKYNFFSRNFYLLHFDVIDITLLLFYLFILRLVELVIEFSPRIEL